MKERKVPLRIIVTACLYKATLVRATKGHPFALHPSSPIDDRGPERGKRARSQRRRLAKFFSAARQCTEMQGEVCIYSPNEDNTKGQLDIH